MSNRPTVSIIMSVHNGAASLDRCLASISQQSYQDYELVCVDDASTDRTAAILKRWQARFKPNQLKLLTNSRNLGLTKSLNRSSAAAKGSYLARLDADDWWTTDKLKRQLAWLKKTPDYGLLGSNYVNHWPHRRQLVKPPQRDGDIKKYIFRRNPFGHSCVIINKELFNHVGGYNEALRYGQDLDLWFRLMPLTKFHNLDQYLCHREINETLNKRQQMRAHIKTTAAYIHKYQASWTNYLYLLEPLAVIVTPTWLRKSLSS